MGLRALQTFTFYIVDTRYGVPTIEFVTNIDLTRAREIAVERLTSSVHHTAVAVYDREVLLFRVSQQDSAGSPK